MRNRIHSGLHNISIHSLTRRLTGTSFTTLLQSSYFNSQPHKEADETTFQMALAMAISIHSLTRRLTAMKTAVEWFQKFQFTASQGG